ncbi:MAG: alpha/beta hydrolase family protein [Solirubrobacteraceae bacterium]
MSFEAILNRGRMTADGIPYPDIEQAEAAAGAGDEVGWFDFWMAKADDYERIGTEAVDAGRALTGGRWLWHASLSAHYAQFMWFHDPPRREAGQRRKAELYAHAAPYLDPPAERVELPFEGAVIPGYLRLPPAGAGPHPCAILVGGLESTKEESSLFEALCLRRGLATFAFDGPGQGEMFFDVKLRPDFERYGSAVVDHLVGRPEIDATRIGVLGRSLGGHYAPKLAAHDPRVRACCCWGACFDMSEFDRMPPHTQDGFLYVTGIADRDEGRAYLQQALDLAPVAGDIRCPVYVLHGRHDVIFSTDHLAKFERHVTGAPLEIVLERDGDHCCHNMGHIVRPRMADWMADRLGAGLNPPRRRGSASAAG